MTETWYLKTYLQIGLHLKAVSVSLKLVNVKKQYKWKMLSKDYPPWGFLQILK